MTAQTATAILTKSYQDAGKLARGGTLSADMLADGIDRMNDLINLWQTQGLRLWLESEVTMPLVSGKQMYSFAPAGDVVMSRPLRIKAATYWDSQSNARSLLPISRDEWTRLSNRTIPGSVNQYFVEKLAGQLNLYLWQLPDATAATGTLKVVVQNQAGQVVIGSDTPSFPPEWTLALRWGVADEICTGMPTEVIERCAAKAIGYRSVLDDWDVEDAETYFQPDMRSYGRTGSFR